MKKFVSYFQLQESLKLNKQHMPVKEIGECDL